MEAEAGYRNHHHGMVPSRLSMGLCPHQGYIPLLPIHRLIGRRGEKRALIAVAHTTPNIIFSMLRNGTDYQDLGINYYSERKKEPVARRAVRRMAKIGYKAGLGAG